MLALPLRIFRRAALAATLGVTTVAATGCDLSTDPNTQPRLEVLLRLGSTLPAPGVAPTLAITPNLRSVQVDGLLVAPCVNARADKHHAVSSGQITIRLTFTSTGAACNEPAPILYSAYLFNVPSGVYNLRVIHEGDRQVPDGTAVFQGEVTIL